MPEGRVLSELRRMVLREWCWDVYGGRFAVDERQSERRAVEQKENNKMISLRTFVCFARNEDQ